MVWSFLLYWKPRFAVFFTAVAVAADSLVSTDSVHHPRKECLESLSTVPLFFLYLYGQGVKFVIYNNLIIESTLRINHMAINAVYIGCLLVVFISIFSDLRKDDKWNPLKWKWNMIHTWRTEDILGIWKRLVFSFALRVSQAVVNICNPAKHLP
jgi:hypothetical protein